MRYARLQEEFNHVQAQAVLEKLHKSLQKRTRLAEENVKLKNLVSKQEKEKEDLQKETTNLKDVVKTNTILYKQHEEDL